ncbi:MAG: hypothetical protein ABJB34_11495, partial [Acidobacteriota bacterium]
MKKRVLLASAALTLLSFTYTMLGDSDVYAQERERVSGPMVKQTASVRKVERNTPAFLNAAAENAALRNALTWTFSGKTQRGWNIYVPLISQAIGVEVGPDTPEFALALSIWQGNAGLLETGVLDEPTMESFRTYWQSRRLGRFERSADDDLLSAPIVEFFDPTRSTDMLQLERDTYAAYKKMVAAAAKDLRHELKLTKDGELAPEEKFLRIVSAYRSPEYQDALRRKEPNAGRGTLAKNSPHSTGHAIDIYVG